MPPSTGQRLRHLRQQVGMSQEALAHASRVSRRTIIRLELGGGDARIETLRRLAVALDTSVSALLGEDVAA